jgi:predicted phosphoribosyltransferase
VVEILIVSFHQYSSFLYFSAYKTLKRKRQCYVGSVCLALYPREYKIMCRTTILVDDGIAKGVTMIAVAR